MLVLNDGTTHHFCSSKCEKNTEIGREARNLEWTDAGRRQGGRRQPEPEPVEEPEAPAEPAEPDEVDAEAEDADTEDEDPETDASDADGEAEEDDEE
jgi:large subunit ribosomal protein L24e